MIGALPESLVVSGREHPIRADYRIVLQVFEAFHDPDLEAAEKWIVAIFLIFSEFKCADDVKRAAAGGFDVVEAAGQITWFIQTEDRGSDAERKPTYDWKQDEQMIFSAINKVSNQEVREAAYLHWWTFLGYFNGIDEGLFSFVVSIRDKQNRHIKLEKHEREFKKNNRALVELVKYKTKEQKEEDEFWDKIL